MMWLSDLKNYGFIVINIERDSNKQIIKRCIGITKNTDSPIHEKMKGISTSINTTSNNKESKPSSLLIVEDYFRLKNFDLSEAINFFEYYESNGWKVGRNAMKKWKLAANRWIRNAKPKKKGLSEEYFGDFMNKQNKLT